MTNNKIPTDPFKDEETKDHIYEGSDEQERDQKEPWGHAVEDNPGSVDDMLAEAGVEGDDNGVHELNIQDVIDRNQNGR
jgi:hypothetical protein